MRYHRENYEAAMAMKSAMFQLRKDKTLCPGTFGNIIDVRETVVQLHKIFQLQTMNYAVCLDLTNQLQEFISDKDINNTVHKILKNILQ